MKPMNIILIGAVIAIFGGIASAIGTYLHNKNTSEKSTRIDDNVKRGLSLGETTNAEVITLRLQNADLLKQAADLNSRLEKQTKTIDDLRRENTELYTKLAGASLDIYNNLTGGNSYGRIQMGNINKDQTEGELIFFVDGKYPLSRAHVRIVDLNAPNDFTSLMGTKIDLGTLDDNHAYISGYHIKLDKRKGVNLNVFFGANNGFTTQLIRMKLINERWVSAIRISKLMDDTELYLKIDDNYPSKSKSEIFK